MNEIEIDSSKFVEFQTKDPASIGHSDQPSLDSTDNLCRQRQMYIRTVKALSKQQGSGK
jgi:hypothetical protein